MQRLATPLRKIPFKLTECKHEIMGLLAHITGYMKLFSVFFSSVHEISPVICLLTFLFGEFSQLYLVGETVFLIQHFNQEVVAVHTCGTKLI